MLTVKKVHSDAKMGFHFVEVIELSILQERSGCGANGVGEEPQLGNGSLDTMRRNLDFDFLRGWSRLFWVLI